MGKHSNAPSQTHKSETKICKNLHPKAIRRASPSLCYGGPPRGSWSGARTKHRLLRHFVCQVAQSIKCLFQPRKS